MKRTSIRVEFNIYGDYIDIDNVTEMMKINPTVAYLKGDPIDHRPIVRKNALWAIETNYEEAIDINDVFPKIFGMIADKSDVINRVKELYEAGVSFSFVANIHNGESPAMYLDKDFIKFAAEIGAWIEFPMYVFGDFDME